MTEFGGDGMADVVEWHIEHFATVTSTQILASERVRAAYNGRHSGHHEYHQHANESPHGLVIWADHQSAGRGRLDRRWHDEPGTALMFSAVVELEQLRGEAQVACSASTVTHALAVAVTDVIEVVRIKWPNDLLVNGKKVAGILGELIMHNDETECACGTETVIVGCGMNVRHSAALDGELRATATSLEDELPALREVAQEDLLHDILRAFAFRLQDPSTLRNDFRTRCVTLGQEVRVQQMNAEIVGHAADVDDEGALLVARDADDIVRVTLGDVVHLRQK